MITESVKVGKRFYHALFAETMTALSMVMIPLSEFFAPQLRDIFIALTMFFALRSGLEKYLDSYDDRRIKSDLAKSISKDKTKNKEIDLEMKKIALRKDVFQLKKDVVKQQENFRGSIISTRLINIEKRNEFAMRLALADSSVEVTKDSIDIFKQLDEEVDFLLTDGISAPFEQIAIDKKMVNTIPTSSANVDQKFADINIGEDEYEA